MHAAGRIDQQHSAAGKLLPSRDGLVHDVLQCLLPLRRIPSRSKETEGQNSLRLHCRQGVDDSLLTDAGILHIAKVAQERECTQLALREQPLPVRTLVSAPGKSHFPGVRSEQVSFDETPPQPCLVAVVRLGVAQEKYVAQTDHARTVILSQCILVELGEGGYGCR
jgi:hypothetical protein